jgi:hypothetical protein
MAVPGMTGGESKSLVKYNAKAGKMEVDNQVFDRITLIVDLEHGETGWIKFIEGIPPDFRMVTMASLVAGGPFPPRPADVDSQGRPLFKRGFRLLVKLPDNIAAGTARVREWTSTALVTVRALDQLHTEWLAHRQGDKVPVVRLVGVKKVPGQFGANFEPILEIAKWVDRPADLRPDASEEPEPQPTMRRRQNPPPHVTDPIGEPEQFDENEPEGEATFS